jgi:hypothetical protein
MQESTVFCHVIGYGGMAVGHAGHPNDGGAPHVDIDLQDD